MSSDTIFQALAKKYDTSARVGLAKHITQEIRKHIGVPKRHLIDYGCGTGLVSLPLATELKSLTLIDLSSEMLKVAEKKVLDLNLQNVNIFNLDFSAEPKKINAEDILLSLTLLHIPNTELLLFNLASLLPNGGRLIIVDFNLNKKVKHPKVHSGFDQFKLKYLLLEKIGFKSVESETFFAGQNIFMKQDATLFILVATK